MFVLVINTYSQNFRNIDVKVQSQHTLEFFEKLRFLKANISKAKMFQLLIFLQFKVLKEV